MALKNEFIGIKISPQAFASKFTTLRNNYTIEDRKRIDNVERFTIKTMKQNTPLGQTGKTRASIRSLSKKSTKGATDLRSVIVVGSDYPVFKYLDRGTKPSPGRFIPILGKRLVNATNPGFGFHPGIKPRNILEKTQRSVEHFMDLENTKSLSRWSKIWNMLFRG